MRVRRQVLRGQRSAQAGFTMIELLVVVAILAVLGGIGVLAAIEVTQDGDEAACLVERRSIENAMWAAKRRTPPTETYGDFLEGTPKYFTNSGTLAAPVWGGSSEHPAGACPASIPTP